jgi:mono/diheme cytochrome c family protein
MKNTNQQLQKRLFAVSFLFLAGYICIPSASSAPEPAGAATFKAKCAMCHGQDGGGNTPMGQKLKIRDLRSPEVQKHTDDELVAIISNGKPPMPAYSKTLSADEIHQLVAYLRNMQPKA